MIIVIRIAGIVNITDSVEETLYRTRLRRKYAAVLLKPTVENIKLVKKIRNFVAYGDIDNLTLKELIRARGILKNRNGKLNVDKVVEEIEKKSPKSWSIKQFFRLHPPRGGIDSKNHFGTKKKAVLGDNKSKINDLVRRML